MVGIKEKEPDARRPTGEDGVLKVYSPLGGGERPGMGERQTARVRQSGAGCHCSCNPRGWRIRLLILGSRVRIPPGLPSLATVSAPDPARRRGPSHALPRNGPRVRRFAAWDWHSERAGSYPGSQPDHTGRRLAAPVQYGKRIGAFVLYLLHYQLLPEKSGGADGRSVRRAAGHSNHRPDQPGLRQTRPELRHCRT